MLIPLKCPRHQALPPRDSLKVRTAAGREITIGSVKTFGDCECERLVGGRGKFAKGVTLVDGLDVLGYDDPYRWTSCVTSCAVALYGRFLLQLVESYRLLEEQAEVWEIARNIVAEFRAPVIVPYTYEEVIASFDGWRRKLYQRAYDCPRFLTLQAMAVVKIFIKGESYSWKAAQNKPPRVISPRSVEFRLRLSRFIQPIEKAVKNAVLPGCKYPFYAKGMGPRKLAKRFLKMASRFKCPVFTSFDMSRFDGHVNVALLELEFSFYRRYLKDEEFDQLLDAMKINRYEVPGKLKARSLGGRCSGDPNTGLGNTVLMAIMCLAVMRAQGIDCEIFANGDDTIVISETVDQARCIRLFRQFGMEAKIESVSRTLDDIVWCRSKLVKINGVYTWCRDPRRILNTLFVNDRYDTKSWKGLQKTIAQCELSVNLGVPLIDPLCRSIIKQCHVKAWKVSALDTWSQIKYAMGTGLDARKREISQNTKSNYYRAFVLDSQEVARVVGMQIGACDLDRTECWEWGCHPTGFGNAQL